LAVCYRFANERFWWACLWQPAALRQRARERRPHSRCSSALAERAVMDEPRPLPLPHKSRSTSCSETAPVETATTSARWLDVQKHKPLPTRGVTTAVRSAHQARPLRPACRSWKGAVGQPAPAFPANRRNRSRAPVLRRRKRLRSEKNSSPKNRRRIVGCTSCISSSASRDFGRKYGIHYFGPNRHTMSCHRTYQTT
jgi:hypothetical protein